MTAHTTTRRVWAVCSLWQNDHKHITTRALMKALGPKSLNTVHYHLKKLVEAGYLSHGPRQSGGTWFVKVPLITMRKERTQ